MNLIADEDDFLDSLASKATESNLEWIGGDGEGSFDGCRLLPSFGAVARPLQRRMAMAVLEALSETRDALNRRRLRRSFLPSMRKAPPSAVLLPMCRGIWR